MGRCGEVWGERVRAVRALHLVPVRHVVRLEPRGQLAVDRDDHLVRFRVRYRVRVRVRLETSQSRPRRLYLPVYLPVYLAYISPLSPAHLAVTAEARALRRALAPHKVRLAARGHA